MTCNRNRSLIVIEDYFRE